MAVIPTNDGLTCMVAGWHPERHPVDGHLRALASIPAVAKRVGQGERQEKLRAIGALTSFFR
jgi:hypothetical protein